MVSPDDTSLSFHIDCAYNSAFLFFKEKEAKEPFPDALACGFPS
jgi:hypothetical protein